MAKRSKGAQETGGAPEEAASTEAAPDQVEEVEAGQAEEQYPEAKTEIAKAACARVFSVTSVAAQFYRCGRKFTKQPTLISEDEIEPAQLERILAEPNLKSVQQ